MTSGKKKKQHELNPSWRERWRAHKGPYPMQWCHPMGHPLERERTRYRYRVWLDVQRERARFENIDRIAPKPDEP